MWVIPAVIMALVMVMGVGSGPAAYADHPNAAVSIPAGTSVPGCEETNECFIPSDVTIEVGGEVTWSNDDNAAHTVTSSISSDDNSGQDFDSGLFLVGTTFSWNPDEAGVYPYYCIVHPWMIGSVTVVAEDDHMMEISASGMLSDGTLVEVYADGMVEGEMTEIIVVFVDSEHVNYDLMVTQDGETVLDDVGAHEHTGEGTHRTAPLGSSSPVDVTITFQGYGIDEITGPVGEAITFTNIVSGIVSEPEVAPEPDTMDRDIVPVEYSGVVSIPEGSGVVGCERDNACYIPADILISAGDEVTWSNDDNAAHTVTSGTPGEGDSGEIFDSGLLNSAGTFSATFEAQGKFPYYCIVHPWMVGSVTVNTNAPRPGPEPRQEKPALEPEPMPEIEPEPEIPKTPETSEVPRTSGLLEPQNPDDTMIEPEETPEPESLEPDIGLVEPEVIPDPTDQDIQDTQNDQGGQDSQNMDIQADSEPVPETAPEAIPEPEPAPEPAATDPDLEKRIEELEGRVGILEGILDSLRSFFGF